MISAAQFDQLSTPITDLFEQYQISVIRDIARRLGNLSFSSAAWQVQRLNASGMLYNDILEHLSRVTGQSEAILRDTFQKAGVRALSFDNAIYKAAGLSPLPLNLSPSSLNTLLAGLNKTSGLIRNLTLSTALMGQEAFISASDLAYMQTVSGSMSYDQAIRAAVKDVAAKGLSTIDYASGRKDQLNVAIRRTVLTGIAQTTGELQLMRAHEMGCEYVRVSAHVGCRPSHLDFQGKVFALNGFISKSM